MPWQSRLANGKNSVGIENKFRDVLSQTAPRRGAAVEN